MRHKLIDRRFLMAVFAFLLSIGLPLSAAADGANGVSSQEMAALDEARDVFHSNCAMCHGYDGVPILPGAPNFSMGERLEKSDAELLKVIANGTETMPPWKDVLSEEQRSAALAFIRVLPGDVLFTEQCKDCHGTSVPALSDAIPKSREKLDNYAGPWEICSGCNIEEMMKQEDVVKVIKFLRNIPKPASSEAN